jgi:hypothetical protein
MWGYRTPKFERLGKGAVRLDECADLSGRPRHTRVGQLVPNEKRIHLGHPVLMIRNRLLGSQRAQDSILPGATQLAVAMKAGDACAGQRPCLSCCGVPNAEGPSRFRRPFCLSYCQLHPFREPGIGAPASMATLMRVTHSTNNSSTVMTLKPLSQHSGGVVGNISS